MPANTLQQAMLASPLGRIRLSCRAGRLSALDFVDEPSADHELPAARPSEGLLDGRPIRSFRLAEPGELSIPIPVMDASPGDAGCVLIQESLHPDTDVADIRFMHEVAAALSRYFLGELKAFSIPLALQGSAFQQAIWQALLTIPYGASLSYGQLAQKAGYAAATYGRAAGTAVGRNPVSIIVPCHRIVGTDGRLTGYSGSLWRKLRLLSLEGCRVSI